MIFKIKQTNKMLNFWSCKLEATKCNLKADLDSNKEITFLQPGNLVELRLVHDAHKDTNNKKNGELWDYPK